MFNLCSSTWPKSQLRADWACLCGPFGALAGVLLDLAGQGGDLLGDPFGPGLAHGVE